MSYDDIFNIATAILASVGGSAIIIIGLSSWLAKVWVNRIHEKDKLKYSSELEKIKATLQKENEKQKLVFSIYFEGQFKIYNNLWLSLVNLENEVDKLWLSATNTNLSSFVKAIQKAKKQIKDSALLIEKEHYIQILENLKSFEDYKIGKETLIQKRNYDSISENEIKNLINSNKIQREQITLFTNDMLEKMRIQIGGTDNKTELNTHLLSAASASDNKREERTTKCEN